MTNPIEQLGGYDEAKAFLNAASYTVDELIMMQRSGLRPQHVEKALIEHRRQHNIYEEGDWIIYDDDLMVFAMWSKHHNEYAYIGYANADDGALEHRSAFRHATDEEIAQGYRDE